MISFERVFREKRSIVLPLLIALAVNIVLLVLAVLPLMQSVSSEQARAAQVARDRADAEQAHARAEAIVRGKSRADQELARFYGQVLPPNQTGARRIAYLNLQQLAESAGLTLSSQSTTVSEPTEMHGLTTYTTDVVLSGTYRGIRQFIYEVETQPAFLVIERLDLATATGQNDPLKVTVTLATYYRAADGG